MMLKNFITVIIMFLLMTVFTSVATASYTGTYMFTANGNDNDVDSVELLVNEWFINQSLIYRSDIELFCKLEAEDAGLDDDVSFIWSGNEHKSGIWQSDDETIKFYSVKGGTQYAMYWVDPELNIGLFSTENILNKGGNIPSMSHISFWKDKNVHETIPTPTPEPATLLLFGIGLLGLAHTQRKE